MTSLMIALLLATMQAPAMDGAIEQGIRSEGDYPPTEYLSLVGPYGVTFSMTGIAQLPFVLSGIPAGASVARALFITQTWDEDAITHTIDLNIDGTTYEGIAALALDIQDTGNPPYDLDLASYVIDVTAQITGNGQYDPHVTRNQPSSGPYASLLWVVYEREDLPWQEVHLNFGGESLMESSSTSMFTAAGSGSGTLHIFTEADDDESNSEGTESVVFNNQVIACCQVFNRSTVQSGTYLQLPVTVVPGPNIVTVNTGTDWLGWHVAALVVPVGTISVSQQSWSTIKALYR